MEEIQYNGYELQSLMYFHSVSWVVVKVRVRVRVRVWLRDRSTVRVKVGVPGREHNRMCVTWVKCPGGGKCKQAFRHLFFTEGSQKPLAMTELRE